MSYQELEDQITEKVMQECADRFPSRDGRRNRGIIRRVVKLVVQNWPKEGVVSAKEADRQIRDTVIQQYKEIYGFDPLTLLIIKLVLSLIISFVFDWWQTRTATAEFAAMQDESTKVKDDEEEV